MVTLADDLKEGGYGNHLYQAPANNHNGVYVVRVQSLISSGDQAKAFIDKYCIDGNVQDVSSQRDLGGLLKFERLEPDSEVVNRIREYNKRFMIDQTDSKQK